MFHWPVTNFALAVDTGVTKFVPCHWLNYLNDINTNIGINVLAAVLQTNLREYHFLAAVKTEPTCTLLTKFASANFQTGNFLPMNDKYVCTIMWILHEFLLNRTTQVQWKNRFKLPNLVEIYVRLACISGHYSVKVITLTSSQPTSKLWIKSMEKMPVSFCRHES